MPVTVPSLSALSLSSPATAAAGRGVTGPGAHHADALTRDLLLAWLREALAAGSPADGLAVADRFWQRPPSREEAWFLRGEVLRMLRHPEAAVRGLTGPPREAVLAYLLAALDASAGQVAAVAPALRDATRLLPGEPLPQARLDGWLGALPPVPAPPPRGDEVRLSPDAARDAERATRALAARPDLLPVTPRLPAAPGTGIVRALLVGGGVLLWLAGERGPALVLLGVAVAGPRLAGLGRR